MDAYSKEVSLGKRMLGQMSASQAGLMHQNGPVGPVAQDRQSVGEYVLDDLEQLAKYACSVADDLDGRLRPVLRVFPESNQAQAEMAEPEACYPPLFDAMRTQIKAIRRAIAYIEATASRCEV